MVVQSLCNEPPLIRAIFSGEEAEVRQLLDSNNVDVHYCDEEKRTALHAAAYRGEPDLVELLLTTGARVNSKDNRWLTPLHRACASHGPASKQQRAVEILLQHGADVNARDKTWQTPFHVAAAHNAVEAVRRLVP